MLRPLIHGFMALTIFFAVPHAEAGRKPASIRAPKPAPGGSGLTDGQWDDLNKSYLEMLMRRSIEAAKAAPSKKAFQNYIKALPAEDRRLLKEIDGKDIIPNRLEGDTFVFVQDGKELRIRWPNFTEYKFEVNGVRWNFNPKVSLTRQLEALIKKIEFETSAKKSDTKSALFSIAFPEARAIWPLAAPAAVAGAEAAATAATGLTLRALMQKFGGWIAGAVLTTGGAVLTTGGSDTVCALLGDATKKVSLSWCAGYRETLEKAKAKDETKTAGIASIERAKPATDVEGTLEWIPSRDIECPSTSDPSKTVFNTDMRQLRIFTGPTGNKVVPVDDWFALRVEFDKDGKPKTGATAPRGTDLSAQDAASKATNLMIFDERGLLKEIRYKNPEPRTGTDPGYKDMLSIDTLAEDSKLTSKELSMRMQLRSLVKSLDEWVTFCMKRELINKFREQQKEAKKADSIEAIGSRPERPRPAPAAAPAAPASQPAIQ